MTLSRADTTHADANGGAALVLVGCLCGGLSLAGVLITVRSPIVDHPALFAALRGILTFGLLAIGVYGWAHDPGGRYPALLLIFCCMFALTSLTGVDDPWWFALGRVAVAGGTVFVAYVFLSYPYGRLDDRAAAVLVVTAAVGTAVLLGLTLLFSVDQPVAGPFVRCAGSCPENPLTVGDSAARVGRAAAAASSIWTVGIAVGTAVLLARRARCATALGRRSLGPVLAWTTLVSSGYGVYLAVRVADPDGSLLSGMGTVVAAIIALIPAALAVGLVQGRVVAAGALRRTVAGLGERPSPTGLRDALARAFRDPSLELVFWLPAVDGYVDESGRGVELPAHGPRAVTRFDRHGVPVAAAIHDAALVGDTGALEAARGVVLLALENARLEADLRARANELRVSRARLVAVADEERRRIERDLHDGAQQYLVAVRIELGLLRELVEDDSALASGIAGAEDRIDTALELIRELAHGIYPHGLRYEGLSHALAGVASRLPLPITVHADGLGRVAPQIETAVYFCCLEALQNVAKHATIRTPVDVQLTANNGELRFSVVDHGPGFDSRRAPQGHGLTGMRDRIGAIGGELDIVSTPGHGATVTGHVPLDGA